MIIGYSGETIDTMEQTLDLIRRLKPDEAFVCVATSYPGTVLCRLVDEKGWEMSIDWSRNDSTTPVFENPSISKEKILEMRKKFVDGFYSLFYILRQMVKGKFYDRLLAELL